MHNRVGGSASGSPVSKSPVIGVAPRALSFAWEKEDRDSAAI
jgi:hypothetical protein